MRSTIQLFVIVFFLAFVNDACAQNYLPKTIYLKTKVGYAIYINPCDSCSEDWRKWSISDRFKKVLSDFDVTSFVKAFPIDNPSLNTVYKVSIKDSLRINGFIDELNELGEIEYAEKIPIARNNFSPNDAHSNQWALTKIKAFEAWDITKGDIEVKIGIVDDAVRTTHQDIRDNLWVNPGEIANNGIDDDGNGYIDDINGYDVADNDNDPSPPTNAFNGDFSHGTHVAGIAAAATDNAVGVSGLGFKCRIVAVKTKASASGGSSLTAPYDGVAYAIAAKVDVINMSWGSPFPSQTGQALMDAAYNAGIVLVAAAGNDNSSNLYYPAAYDHVISVSATDQSDKKASFSNYGTWVDVSAPGVGIYSSMSLGDAGYGDLSGTSMAAPYVAGLAGLMRSLVPGMSPDEVEDCIENTSEFIDNVNPGYAGELGAGRIDAEAALKCLQVPPRVDFSSDIVRVCPGQQVQFFDESMVIDPINYSWSFVGGTPNTSNEKEPLVTYNTSGTYKVELTVTNSYGIDNKVKSGYIVVGVPEAAITGDNTIINGGSSQLKVEFSGNPPYSFTYSDGTNTTTVNNVMVSPYYFNVSPTSTASYQITSFSDAFCLGTTSGSATVTVTDAQNSGLCNSFLLYGNSGLNYSRGHVYNPVANAYYTVTRENNTNLVLHRFDASGILQASTSHSFSPNNVRVSDLEVAPNGDILFAGGLNNTDLIIVRLDMAGNIIWQRKYDKSNERNSFFVKGNGDTYFAVTWINGTGGDDILINHIDGSGAVIWTKQYDMNSADDQPTLACSNQNGGVTVITEYVPSQRLGAIFEVDNAGTVVKSFSYTTPANTKANRPTSGYVDQNGITYLAGTKEISGSGDNLIASLYIHKLDANGDFVWTREINNVRRRYTITRVVTDVAGNVYVTTNTDLVTFSGNEFPVLILKYDPNGNLLWSKAMKEMGIITDIEEGAGANEISISGYTNQHADGYGQVDSYFAVVDNDFNTCLTEDVTTAPVSNNWVKTQIPFTVTDINMAESNLNAIPSPSNFQYMNLCGAIANFTLAEDRICVNQILSVVNNSLNASSYKWYIDGVEVDTTKDLINYSFPNTGTYELQLSATVDTCTSMKVSNVVVLDTCNNCGIIADFGRDSILCPGDVASFTNKTVIPATATNVSYKWEFGPTSSPAVSTLENPSNVSFSGPGTFPVVLIVSADCDSDTVTKNVLVYDYPAVDPIPDEELCSGEYLQFPQVHGFDYKWSPPTGLSNPNISNPVVTLQDTTQTYIVDIISQNTGCATKDTVTITAYSDPQVIIESEDTLVCVDQPTQLRASALLEGSFLWSTGHTSSEITVKPNATTIYQVNFTSKNGGCLADTTFELYVNTNGDCWDIEIPNVFTPNRDGDNEFFTIKNIGLYPEAKLTIFNRWGNVVWESTEPYYSHPWDGKRHGKDMPVAVYYYILDLGNGDKTAGGVTLLR